jgi:hypothetical protein
MYTGRRGTNDVRGIALGKEPRPGHRYRFFAECSGSDTRQRTTIWRVPYQALGKVPDRGAPLAVLCRVLSGGHSAKWISLPSAVRRTLGKDSISITRRRNGCFSLPGALWHSANLFVECPRKSTRQRRLSRCTVCRALFAKCDTF